MDSKFIGAIVVGVAIVALLAACNALGFVGILALPLGLAAVALANRPKALLLLFWVLTLLVPSVEVFLPDLYIKALEQISCLYLLAILLADIALRRVAIPQTGPVFLSLILVLVTMVASTLANSVPLTPVVYYTLIYLKHYWIFFFALRYLKEEDARHVFWIAVASFVIQIPLNAAAYAGINPLPRLRGRVFVDYSVGTLGSSHHVGYFMIALLLLLVASLRQFHGIRAKAVCYVAIMAALVQFYFTYTVHAFPILLGALLMQYILFSRKAVTHMIRALVGGSILLAVLAFFFAYGPQRGVTLQIVSQRKARTRINELVWGTKGEAYRHVFFRASEHLNHPIVGGGPGNYTSMLAFSLRRPMAWLPHMAYRYYAYDQKKVRGASMSSVPWTGLISLWGELGPFGCVVFWGAYVYAGIRVFRLHRKGRYRTKYKRVMAETFVPVMAVFLLLNLLIEAVAKPHLNVGLWIWAACVWRSCPDPEEQETEGA